MILPDLLDYNLDVVFCGSAAGDKSAERKAYYAGSGNQFYPVLSAVGFTPYTLKPESFSELLKFKIGLTDIAKLVHGTDDKIRSEDYDVMSFHKKIAVYKPKVLCFNGKKAATVYFNLKNTGLVPYGLHHSTINNTRVFVAPSTSGSARAYWDEQYYYELKAILASI